MQDSLARLRQVWQDTSRANQMMIMAAVAALLIVGAAFIYWAGTPDYKVLVSNASAENQNKILTKLKERKIAYRITNGVIEVPSADQDELSISLAADGLLDQGSQGWGILEKAPFGQTQAMEQETIRHAHEV